jgi:Ni/Co efflux regulator RcnB
MTAQLRRPTVKKFIIAALAATVATTPILAAPFDRHDDRGGRYTQNDRDSRNNRDVRIDRRVQKQVVIRHDDRRGRSQYRSWNRGDRFDNRYARNYRVISSPRAYRLYDAPRGYRWVQSGNDAVLVGITSGIIASVMANMIR